MDRYYLLQYDCDGQVCNPYCKYYLLYGENCKNVYEELVDDHQKESAFVKEIHKLHAIMNKLHGNNLPWEKFHSLPMNYPKNGKDCLRDLWEFKTKHLRVYVVKMDPSKGDSDFCIIYAGFKTEQGNDIKFIREKFKHLDVHTAQTISNEELEELRDARHQEDVEE